MVGFFLSEICIKSYEKCVTAESQGFPLPVLSYLERLETTLSLLRLLQRYRHGETQFDLDSSHMKNWMFAATLGFSPLCGEGSLQAIYRAGGRSCHTVLQVGRVCRSEGLGQGAQRPLYSTQKQGSSGQTNQNRWEAYGPRVGQGVPTNCPVVRDGPVLGAGPNGQEDASVHHQHLSYSC